MVKYNHKIFIHFALLYSLLIGSKYVEYYFAIKFSMLVGVYLPSLHKIASLFQENSSKAMQWRS